MEPIVNAVWQGRDLSLLRRKGGKLVEERHPAELSFFVRAADWSKIERDVRSSRRVVSHKREGEFVRIVCRDRDFRWDIAGPRGFLEQRGVEAFEADLHPVSRFLIDSHVEIARPLHANLDLETDPRPSFGRKEEMRILCWALDRWDGDQVLGVLEEDSDEAERELLLDLLYELEDVDQIRAWNGDRFDFPVLQARLERCRIKVDLRRWLLLDAMLAFEKYNTASESGDEKESMALERVAESLKIDVDAKTSVDASKSWELWSGGGEGRRKLAARCSFDASVMGEIERRTGFCELHYAVCQISGCLPDTRGLNAKTHVEALLLRVCAKRGIRAPSNWSDDRRFGKKIEGAYVHPATPGLHRNVHVCDFSGMYPAIIQSWNIGLESHRPELSGRPGEKLDDVVARLPPGHCVAPLSLQVFDTREESVLAFAVGELKRMRMRHKNRASELKKQGLAKTPEWVEADRLSQGAKVAVNSCFGIASSPHSRFFKRECGESITTTGKHLILATIERGETRWQVRTVLSDTDSLGGTDTSAATYGRFVRECNAELYPPLLKRLGCVRNEMVLDFDESGGDTYGLIVITAKKRYAARALNTAVDADPIVKGLEFKRGDQSRPARRLQIEAVRLLMLAGKSLPEGSYPITPEDLYALIEQTRELVTKGELPRRDVVINKSLGKAIDAYQEPLPEHVRVAKVLLERGRDMSEGARVEYVVTDGDATPQGVEPAEDWSPGKEDRAYLWEKRVWPPTRRLLEAAFPDHRWARFDDGKPRAGGKGRSRYTATQEHFSFFER